MPCSTVSESAGASVSPLCEESSHDNTPLRGWVYQSEKMYAKEDTPAICRSLPGEREVFQNLVIECMVQMASSSPHWCTFTYLEQASFTRKGAVRMV